MTALRVLHVDDEQDIRDVVEIALGLDPALTVHSCPCGGDAIVQAAEWEPDLILLDVMMPGMDGPTTLARLRASPRTTDIPVVFMTARAQSREKERFLALGAEGVISKPFDPLTLAASVRSHMRKSVSILAGPRERFLRRAHEDAATLAQDGLALEREKDTASVLERIKSTAHRLAGSGATCGLAEISTRAFALEDAASGMLEESGGSASRADVARALDELVECLERAQPTWRT